MAAEANVAFPIAQPLKKENIVWSKTWMFKKSSCI